MKRKICVTIAIFFTLCSGCASPEPKLFGQAVPEEVELAESLSKRLLDDVLALRGYSVMPEDLSVGHIEIDDISMAHARYYQRFAGIPVFNGEAIVHLNSDGSLFGITDELIHDIRLDDSGSSILSPDDAIQRVLSEYECPECLSEKPEADLWVFRRADRDTLAYRIQLRREDGTERTSLPVIFSDARTGAQIWAYDNLQTILGKGDSLYSGNGVSVETYLRSGTYYLEDTGRKVGTFDNKNTTNTPVRFMDADNQWSSSDQKAAIDIHYCMESFVDFYKTVFNRNGIDGNGGPGKYMSVDFNTQLITSVVHYGVGYNNAFWNGSSMTYGDGDGVMFSPLTSLDVCGHEMQHGVTQFTANLTYAYESGALNESWSDVIGALFELYTQGDSPGVWRIGDNVYTPGIPGDALRYLDTPHAAANKGYTANDDPDHYSERYTGSGDSGGVHINSGIPNKAFHLLAMGGTHSHGGSMAGIGTTKAGQIWYKALTSFMTSGTNFTGARAATLNAAGVLYGQGSVEKNAVAQAWTLVGVN